MAVCAVDIFAAHEVGRRVQEDCFVQASSLRIVRKAKRPMQVVATRGGICALRPGDPSQDVRIAAQLLEADDLGMLGGQIDKEVAYDDVVVTCAGRSKCGA